MNSTGIALPATKASEAKLLMDKKLMRAALLMLAMMATAFGGATWNVVQDFSIEIKAIPVVLFVVVCVIVAQLYAKTSEVTEVSASTVMQQDQHAALTSDAEVRRVLDKIAATQLCLHNGLQDLRAGLEIMTAVNVLQGSEKDEVERLLIHSLAALHKQV